MSAFTLYLILTLDSIIGALTGAGFIFGLLTFVGAFGTLVNWYEYNEVLLFKFTKTLKYFAPLFLFVVFSVVVLPNTKQAAVIYLIPKVVNNEQLQGTANKGLEILELQVEKYLRELKGETVSQVKSAPTP